MDSLNFFSCSLASSNTLIFKQLLDGTTEAISVEFYFKATIDTNNIVSTITLYTSSGTLFNEKTAATADFDYSTET